MKIDLIAVGRVKEKHMKLGIEEYAKRLKPYATVKIIEVQDEPTPDNAGELEERRIKELEGQRILRKLKKDTVMVALERTGKQKTSEELSTYLQECGLQGKSHVAFVIGGSLGLAETVLDRANLLLSFSKLTFPHQLMRLVLIEQIYRSFKIWRGEPYHK